MKRNIYIGGRFSSWSSALGVGSVVMQKKAAVQAAVSRRPC